MLQNTNTGKQSSSKRNKEAVKEGVVKLLRLPPPLMRKKSSCSAQCWCVTGSAVGGKEAVPTSAPTSPTTGPAISTNLLVRNPLRGSKCN
ncbi:hypothetical protein J6590_044489 [Homalodisca vitripennis]|nr:hypothetical protein J6590_044489 [Homalodisca vitripennis]